MAGFFSLGNTNTNTNTNNNNNQRRGNNNNNDDHDEDEIPQQHQQNSSNWYVYRNDEHISPSYNKGFELWHQQQHHHQQQQQQHDDNTVSIAAYPSTSAVGLREHERERARSELMMMMRSGSGSISSGRTEGGSGSGGVSCQDCGNQAKKDCHHMRCRTCCKSRGFDCPTHVRSTWIPASVRRDRHQKIVATVATTSREREDELERERERELAHDQHAVAVSKRRRGSSSSTQLLQPVVVPHHQNVALATTNNNAATNTTSTSAGMEVANFPAEVSAQALFRCVKVSSIDGREDEYAYQTAVSIGGHVFKGILYDDQRPNYNYQHQQRNQGHGASTSTPSYLGGGDGGGEARNTLSAGEATLNLTAGPASASMMAGTSPSIPAAIGFLDPSMYPVPLNSYLPPGTPFFPHPRP